MSFVLHDAVRAYLLTGRIIYHSFGCNTIATPIGSSITIDIVILKLALWPCVAVFPVMSIIHMFRLSHA